MQPKIFIGSSVSGLPVAYAIQEELEHDADINIWSQGIFNLTASTLAELMNALNTFDFAVFVFSADDPIEFKDEQFLAVRDNVIFEAGLFIGRLGTEKVFFIKPRNAKRIKLPTDLLGITPGDYDDSKENLNAAVGAFCNKVRKALKKFVPGSNQTLPQFNLSKIKENSAKHEVKILNDQGDALITKTLNFTVIEDSVSDRAHGLFCDTFPMSWEEIDLKAVDSAGNRLHIDIERDSPNRKSFKITFKNCIYKGKSIEYSYSYFWKKVFPQKSEYFTFKMAAPKTSFVLHYPSDWTIQFIKAEQNLDGVMNKNIRIENQLTQTLDGFIYEEYAFDTESYNAEIKVSWKRS
ncbi:nucleotide-binding protein [Mucilaginibacter daejeonensis]|uniref:TIR domain-containing protein n=1 Tax=Mucilaginibacter daejeonensis TaxID=398049 RepID=UPI001D178630|nr:nucleotide-binding protein [Mucilaginibacter daejeonensis]UEG54037.1 nucleotide-binding protein [Mucilaginibacter daejeonensis]